jgi:hypothetical protein
MATSLVLQDLEGAIINASTQGSKYGEKMVVGNWELIFEEAGVSGPLPKLFHSSSMPYTWAHEAEACEHLKRGRSR